MWKKMLGIWLVAAVSLGAGELKGRWRSEDGTSSLNIVSKSRLVYNGQELSCRIDAKVIYVADDGEIVAYPYRFEGKRLLIAFPQGYTVRFRRIEGRQAPTTASSSQNALLAGTFCTYSGSSGGGTSYSSNPWVRFDGRNRFSYGTNAYYSGGGDAYATEGGADGGGTYEVRGNSIVLHFSDGTRGMASVHFRQNSGRITEVKYGSAVYAPQLCE